MKKRDEKETTNNYEHWYNNPWIVGFGTWFITSILSNIFNNRDAILKGIQTGFAAVTLQVIFSHFLISSVITLFAIIASGVGIFISIRGGVASRRYGSILLIPAVVISIISILVVALNGPLTSSSSIQVGSSTPVATHAPTAITTETLKIYFAKGNSSITTSNSYKGTITISISGVAKSSDVEFADAFYFYPPFSSRIHNRASTLWINDQPVDSFLKTIPSYKADHNYSFVINVPNGKLTFGAGSLLAQDKTGYFTLTLRT